MFSLETKAEATVYQAGKELIKASLLKEKNRINGHMTGADGCRVCLTGCILSGVQGADMEIQGKDTVLTIKGDDVTFSCSFQRKAEEF